MDVYSKSLLGCTSFLSCLMLLSCGGGSKTPEGDFTLTSTPATVMLVQGGVSQSISVNALPVNGFAGTVAVTITGLPAGVAATPGSLILMPGTAQNVTVTAAASAAMGNATLTFTEQRAH